MPEPAIEPPFNSRCESCDRDTPTVLCFDIDGTAWLLCVDCSEVLNDA